MGEVAVSGGMEAVEREEEVVGKDGGEEPAGRVVRWEKFLPRMFLRVLLVEADDSTRQIIAALLRKCSYRVSATSDGLKAWETLKDKSQSIDLVLTELDLPSVSGYALLTLIMEHDMCKNIPVIMMSSHDSINMVFKCMLKGAADFLVKPIRKNELMNLWQHVWRRQSSNGAPGGKYEHHAENITQLKSGANSVNNAASNHSSDFIGSLKKNRVCFQHQQGSDTQSSCTKPDMEGESTYVQNIQEQKQSDCIVSSVIDYRRDQKDDTCEKLDEQCQVEDTGGTCCNQVVTSCDCIIGKHKESRLAVQRNAMQMSHGDVQNIQSNNYKQKSVQNDNFREVDLVHSLDDQSLSKHRFIGYTAIQPDISSEEIINDVAGQKLKPSLQLSLQRYQHITAENHEKDEINLLNHSHFSAFSRYNSRVVLSPLSTPNDLKNSEMKDYSSGIVNSSSTQRPFGGKVSYCDTSALNMNLADSGSSNSCKDVTIPQSNVGVIPFSLPIAGIPFDGLPPRYGSVMQPVFCTQSGRLVWGPSPSNQENACVNLEHQSELQVLDALQSNHPSTWNSEKQLSEIDTEQIQDMESAACNGNPIDAGRSKMETANGNGHFIPDGIKMVDAQAQRSVQREAALNKFRLKRKDRCFEKKVRYQSRKRLAEQRPRIKGQFVRQTKPDTGSLDAGPCPFS